MKRGFKIKYQGKKDWKDFLVYYKKYKEKFKHKIEELTNIVNENWPIEKWKDLELEQYYRPGKEYNEETFVYNYENKIKQIWESAIPIIIGNERAYGYKIAPGNEYQIENGQNYNRRYYENITKENIDEEWKTSKENIFDFLMLIKKNNITEGFDIVEKEKHIHINIFLFLAYLYFPEKFIGACTKKRINQIAELLDIKLESGNEKEEKTIIVNQFRELNEKIREKFRQAGLDEDENGYMITAAIWDYGNENVLNEEPQVNENKDKESKTEYHFISDDDIREIKELLEFNKNIILEGIPGVGKTYIAKKIALDIVGEGKEENVEIIQFHQSYSYEDFIEGLRPKKDGTFEAEPGILKRMCDKINKDENNENEKFVIIIDEINRGNISKIFGEAFMLIEKDKRTKNGYSVKLPYSQEKFSIPDNIYFIGTMNTVDRSIAPFDFALKRRFAKYEIKPCFGDTKVQKEIECYLEDLKSEKLRKIWKNIEKINSCDKFGDLLIGHSYLCGLEEYSVEEIDKNLDLIVNYQILPQLREYFIGASNKYQEAKRMLLEENEIESYHEEEIANHE